MAFESIYWAVENAGGYYLLHGFMSEEERGHWLWETMGLSATTPGGRGMVADLPKRDMPLYADYQGPVIWH